ncbi:MAG: polyphosphate kinase 1, partial [Spirochaetaceae bacterium]|nr:polyphosphate kinase 1 [Spirochaetaceae bacterium]
MAAKKAREEAEGERQFFNREISWLRFNARVLREALDKNNRPLERLKFLSIFSSNMDEFFQVRVAALRRQYASGNYTTDPAGMSPSSQLEEIFREVRSLMKEQYRCLHEEVLPQLAENGLVFILPCDCTDEQKSFLADYFSREIFPVLTPFRVEKSGSIPVFGNLEIHAAFLLAGNSDAAPGPAQEPLLAAVRVPAAVPRIIFLPNRDGKVYCTLLEYAILEYAHHLFPGYTIKESLLFRVARDSDIGVDEERDEDFVTALEEVLANRQYSAVVRLSVTGTSPVLRDMLAGILGVQPAAIFETRDPLDMRSLSPEAFSGFDSLRDEKWKPVVPPDIPDDQPIWESLARKDILVHHPYESFTPVIRLVSEAAGDPDVLAIKITLYRTSGNSPIIAALEKAARSGKQVTAFVELKARFDEERNIEWAERLQRAGGIVVYGIARLKVHAKALLVVRRENAGLRRYVHLSTGNYNDKTARLYTDFSFFTRREEIAYDVSLFFNAITGCSSI